ncbi:MAG: hypothetical protein RBR20_01950 [Desulfobacterales bacterium]|nr:hypothetical protein [Desulfobacteraceae bacterium]MDD3991562.1 hypothetical protein [Desulfobacteraceae bacterium]MDY0310864.1 hypothetical protein [Desulfobacterales bacterium]
MNPPAAHTDGPENPKRPSWWQRFLAWLTRGAAAARSDQGSCPT